MNYLLNEGYDQNLLFEKGKRSELILNNKKYLDLSFAAGSLLLGHQSKIFKEALLKLKKNNISLLAAPNKQAKDYSRILKKLFPNYDKFIFCSTGSEAIMKSLRICKAITNRDIIISVTGSWHGSNDKTLFTVNDKFQIKPLSNGLSKFDQSKIKFIPYNNIVDSKKILDKYRKKICCVLIEPIQASLPNINTYNYLNFLSKYTKKNNLILIFDEIITGLRTDCSSVQSNLKIKPSISTFGKCFGGGMPIGIIALTKKITRILQKKGKKVFFGGTFSANSISTFVGKLTVEHILKNKVKIFNDLDNKTFYLKKHLINFINENNLNISIYNFKSIFRIVFSKENIQNRIQRDFFEKKKLKKIFQFKKFLLKNKIYYPSNGIIFLSSQTTFKDLDKLIKYLKIGFQKYFYK